MYRPSPFCQLRGTFELSQRWEPTKPPMEVVLTCSELHICGMIDMQIFAYDGIFDFDPTVFSCKHHTRGMSTEPDNGQVKMRAELKTFKVTIISLSAFPLPLLLPQ